MGNLIKYHINNEGKIISVMEDGCVSEIGNVSSLFDHNKTIEKTEHHKSHK